MLGRNRIILGFKSVKNVACLSEPVYHARSVMRRETRPTTRALLMRCICIRRAATVLEMLVVIFIIGIALAMLLPSFKRSLQLARNAVCKHNLREIGHSLTMYRVENDGWLPSRALGETEPPSSKENPVWFAQLFPTYLPDPMTLTCPRDPYHFRMARARNHLHDPAVADYSSYGINGLLAYGAGGILSNLDRHMPSRPLDTILVADLGPDDLQFSARPALPSDPPDHFAGGKGVSVYAASSSNSHHSGGPSRNHGILAWDDGRDPLSTERPDPWLTTRHGDGVNILTLAGGVKAARTKELLESPVRRYYRDCAAGGCSLCTANLRDQVYHYSFAHDRLYWWTGPVRGE